MNAFSWSKYDKTQMFLLKFVFSIDAVITKYQSTNVHSLFWYEITTTIIIIADRNLYALMLWLSQVINWSIKVFLNKKKKRLLKRRNKI